MSVEMQCVQQYLHPNPTLALVTRFCYSEAMFCAHAHVSVNACELPTAEERGQYVAIRMPETVVRHGEPMAVTATWQLSSPGATLLRKIISRRFWMDFSAFLEDCKYRAARMGENCGIEAAMNDFIALHGIDVAEYDNLLRYWRRNRESLRAGIEKRRESMEERTGQTLVYTS
jgi:hypothetical protein